MRAIRHGISPEGKPLFMPAVVSTSHLSDEDLGAIIAYVQPAPPVDHELEETYFTPLAKIMMAAGMFGELPVESVSHRVNVAAPGRGQAWNTANIW